MPITRIEHLYSSSSDEDFDGYISEPSTLVRRRHIPIDRPSGSLSLSENEFDSDELEIAIPLKSHLRPTSMNLDDISLSSESTRERSPS